MALTNFQLAMLMSREDRAVAAVREAAAIVEVWQDGGVEVVGGDGRAVDRYGEMVRNLEAVKAEVEEGREKAAWWWRVVRERMDGMAEGAEELELEKRKTAEADRKAELLVEEVARWKRKVEEAEATAVQVDAAKVVMAKVVMAKVDAAKVVMAKAEAVATAVQVEANWRMQAEAAGRRIVELVAELEWWKARAVDMARGIGLGDAVDAVDGAAAVVAAMEVEEEKVEAVDAAETVDVVGAAAAVDVVEAAAVEAMPDVEEL